MNDSNVIPMFDHYYPPARYSPSQPAPQGPLDDPYKKGLITGVLVGAAGMFALGYFLKTMKEQRPPAALPPTTKGP